MKNTLKRGFTLVELLVVVLIIGILSSVALPQYTKAVKKSRGVQIITSAKALADAMNMAYLEDGRYARVFWTYVNASGGRVGEGYDNFDIEIPAITIKGQGWYLGVDNSGSSARVNANSDVVSASLTYHLADGKIQSITCDGSECSSYFPGTMLSSQ